jgi:serine protease Do
VQRGLAVLLLLALSAGLGPAGAAAERWGWLGIRIRDLTEPEMEEITTRLGLREGYGVLVAEVIKGSPAETSALRAGDLIVAIDDRPIVETRALQRLVGASPAGGSLRLVVLRDGRRTALTVRVGEMPPDMVAERVAAEFGFQVRGAGAEDAPVRPGSRPVVVSGVAERSPAARAGLAAGDRVVAVNGEAIAGVEGFQAHVGRHSLDDPLRLRVERRGEPREVVLPAVRAGLPAQ